MLSLQSVWKSITPAPTRDTLDRWAFKMSVPAATKIRDAAIENPELASPAMMRLSGMVTNPRQDMGEELKQTCFAAIGEIGSRIVNGPDVEARLRNAVDHLVTLRDHFPGRAIATKIAYVLDGKSGLVSANLYSYTLNIAERLDDYGRIVLLNKFADSHLPQSIWTRAVDGLGKYAGQADYEVAKEAARHLVAKIAGSAPLAKRSVEALQQANSRTAAQALADAYDSRFSIEILDAISTMQRDISEDALMQVLLEHNVNHAAILAKGLEVVAVTYAGKLDKAGPEGLIDPPGDDSSHFSGFYYDVIDSFQYRRSRSIYADAYQQADADVKYRIDEAVDLLSLIVARASERRRAQVRPTMPGRYEDLGIDHVLEALQQARREHDRVLPADAPAPGPV